MTKNNLKVADNKEQELKGKAEAAINQIDQNFGKGLIRSAALL